MFWYRFILLICFFLITYASHAAPVFKPTLNVLTFMGVLDHELVSKFEEENHVNVRVEFVGSRFEYESRLRSGLRTYDVVISDERILEKLFLFKLLRILPDDLIAPIAKNYPLFTRSKLNLDGNAYLPFLLDPIGIAYNKTHSNIRPPVSWDVLIKPDDNPFWRQRIFVSGIPKQQLLLALLATKKEISTSSWFIPESTTKWLQQLRLQSANVDYPLELGFLGNKISAAVVFYSDYLRLKKVVPNLEFIVPTEASYYDRIAIGWASTSIQESIAKKFIKYIYDRKDEFVKNSNYLSLKIKEFNSSKTSNWILYEDEIPFSKRIENILKGMYSENSYE